MTEAFICDSIRTPIGRFGGALATVRPDDLAAVAVSELVERSPSVEWDRLDDVILGCANQAGEDNRNVARMVALLAGLSTDVPGVTINRLCGSGMEAIGLASRAIKTGQADVIVAGGVESMSLWPSMPRTLMSICARCSVPSCMSSRRTPPTRASNWPASRHYAPEHSPGSCTRPIPGPCTLPRTPPSTPESRLPSTSREDCS